jgi:hypothetical protein
MPSFVDRHSSIPLTVIPLTVTPGLTRGPVTGGAPLAGTGPRLFGRGDEEGRLGGRTVQAGRVVSGRAP